jgi:hypothetical protein
MNKIFLSIGIALVIIGIIFMSIIIIKESYKNRNGELIMKKSNEHFKNINVNVKLRNVKFIITDDNTYGYEFNDKSYSKISHEIKNSTLNITEKLNYLMAYNYFFDLLRGINNDNINIYIPKDSVFENVIITNTTGNINLNNINTQSIDLISTSGNITASEIKTNFLKSKQTSGKLNVNGSIINNCEIKNTSGKIVINNLDQSNLKISTTSGGVTIKGILSGKTEIKSTSGSITLGILDKKQNYNIYTEQTSGKIFINGIKQERKKGNIYNKSENKQNDLKLKTTSGNVKINFD